MNCMHDAVSAFLLRFSRQKYCVLLLLLAFVLRWGAVVGLRDMHQFHGRAVAGADAVEFNALGLNMASGHGYSIVPGRPTSFRAPGFPLVLAALYRISYGNYALVYTALSLIGALTCLLTYAMAREILKEGTARIAGLLGAFYLPHIYF